MLYRYNTKSKVMDFKEQFAELLSSTYISNKASQDEVNNGWVKIYKELAPNIPEKLYRFRTCDVNNLISFQKNTISVCTASTFKDKYDSLIYVNSGLINEMKTQYINEEMFEIVEKGISQGKAHEIFAGYVDDDKIDEIIAENLKLSKAERKEYFLRNGEMFMNALFYNVNSQIDKIRNDNLTKIACFTENVQSLNMWDLYADGYKGYVLEYDFRSCMYKKCTLCNDTRKCDKKELNYTELFPVIYTDEKYDATKDVFAIESFNLFKSVGLNADLFEFDRLFLYKSYLYKNKEEYGHEKEWRMITRCPNDADSMYGSIPDYGCLKAIYYGPEMNKEFKDFWHEVSVQKGIKEYNVSIDKDSPKYELKIEEVR